jgi:membrane AbrB-like protein
VPLAQQLRRAAQHSWVLRCLAVAIAAVAGWSAVRLSLPLPWMIGPLFTFAALALSGLRLPLVPMAREVGHACIGTAVGLRFTPAVLAATVSLLPAMVAATAFVIASGIVAAALFRPLAGVSGVTAYFSTAAGGMAEMAQLAADRGGDAPSVAVVHAMRMSGVVATVPFLVLALESGDAVAPRAAPPLGALWLVAVLVGAGVLWARFLRRRARFIPNPWLVGPLVLAAVLGAAGVVSISLPPLLMNAAQMALGIYLGSEFRREALARLPRVSLAAVAIVAFMLMSAFGGALVLSAATGLDLSVAFLALAPGAVAEMVLTAQVMNLDAEMVTAFHILRIAVVSTAVVFLFRLYNRMRGVPDGPDV